AVKVHWNNHFLALCRCLFDGCSIVFVFFFQAEDGIRDATVTGVQTCALPISLVQPVTGADGKVVTEQTLALGPAASQVAIKQLGTNGGGFFGVNSAHPFENPTPLSNFVELVRSEERRVGKEWSGRRCEAR